MVDALIIDACRTPRGIGKAGKGALAGIHPQQLGATVLRALAERTGIDTADVDDIVWGTSSQRGQQSGDLGRMSALDAGYDIRASAVTLDRFCGSGITSVNMAANSIMAGSEDLVIAGEIPDPVASIVVGRGVDIVGARIGGLERHERIEPLRRVRPAAIRDPKQMAGGIVNFEIGIGEGLANSSQAHTVSVRDGQTVTSDGPFAELKEHLAGFYLLDVASFERAVEIAARVPDAELAEVELRPVLDLRATDL